MKEQILGYEALNELHYLTNQAVEQLQKKDLGLY